MDQQTSIISMLIIRGEHSHTGRHRIRKMANITQTVILGNYHQNGYHMDDTMDECFLKGLGLVALYQQSYE